MSSLEDFSRMTAAAPPEPRDFAFDEMPGEELHAHLAALRAAHGPVAPTLFLGQPAFVILGYETLAAAFRDGERFPPHEIYRIGIEPLIGRNFQTMTGADHKLHRKIATPALRPKQVSGYARESFEAIAHELIDRFADETEVDLAEVFTRLYPFRVITRLMGIPREAEAAFHGWAQGMLHFMQEPARAHECSKAFGDYLAPVLEERRRNPGDDILSSLIHSSEEGVSLSDEEIGSTARLIFSAGATTTHDAIGNLLYALLTHAGSWQRLIAEPELRRGAIDEMLRWEPPVSVLPRTAAQGGIELDGVEVPGGSIVLFGISAANRDSAVFAQADCFDMERQDDLPRMTFGPGLRQCPGMHLAFKQLGIVLDVLLERFPDLRLVDAEAAVARGTAIRGPSALPVRLR
jgi:cytochrome P450